ncbi:MAG: DUF2845 domain-containing protein [Rubrivivax sp.]
MSVALALWLCGSGTGAQAESLQCSGGIAAEGDTRLSVLYKCGQPLLADRFCAPVTYGDSGNLVPGDIAAAAVPCQLTEQWVYERGPGNLVATVHIRSGTVQSIRYGKAPR